MMEPRLESWDHARLSVTVSYPIRDWEKNVFGAVHGGITGAIADTTMGIACYCCTGGFTPTVSLNTSFQRPGVVGSRLFCRAEITMSGRTVIYCDCRVWDENSPEKVISTSQGVFRNLAGDK